MFFFKHKYKKTVVYSVTLIKTELTIHSQIHREVDSHLVWRTCLSKTECFNFPERLEKKWSGSTVFHSLADSNAHSIALRAEDN